MKYVIRFLSLLVVIFVLIVSPTHADSERQFFPDWCYPNPAPFDDVLPKVAWEYCINHPNAKRPPWWLKDLEKSASNEHLIY